MKNSSITMRTMLRTSIFQTLVNPRAALLKFLWAGSAALAVSQIPQEKLALEKEEFHKLQTNTQVQTESVK